MLLRHVQTHAGQLLVQLAGGVAAVVSEKEVLLILVVEPLDELRHAGEDAVPVVDDAVHIADEALFRVEVKRGVGIHMPPLLFCIGLRVLYHRGREIASVNV